MNSPLSMIIHIVEYEYKMTRAEMESLRGVEGVRFLMRRYVYLVAKAKIEDEAYKKAEREAKSKSK